MLVYLKIAPTVYVQYLLEKGKPLQGYNELPVDSDQIRFVVDLLNPVTPNAEDVYTLVGWAFSTKNEHMPPEKYEREIVLISDTNMYFFPIFQVIQRPDIRDAFSILGMDLTYSGFHVLIAKDAIRPGKYRVGIVFRDPSTNVAHYYDKSAYGKPARYLVRTPNNLYIK